MLRRLQVLSLSIAATALFAAAAGAVPSTYPPGPSYRTCPDTLTIYDVQQADTTLAPCHPTGLVASSRDMVLGIAGIITGMDRIAGAYGFYIQNNSNDPTFRGLDVFTGATPYHSAPYNLTEGDSVVVYGTVFEFSPGTFGGGETEVEGPDQTQSTNDIIIRKVSSGNTIPQPTLMTSAQLNWIPALSVATAEPIEGCLVKLRGPFIVGRRATNTAPSAGLPRSSALPASGSFLMYKATNPTDSVAVECLTLSGTAPPAVGVVVDSVVGIVNQRTFDAINSYRVQIRGGADLFLATPPNVSDAFPVEDNKLRIVFDRAVTQASCENLSNYSLASLGSIDAATQVAPNIVEITITNGLVDGDDETVTVNGITGAVNGLTMTAGQALDFVNGVLTLAEIQAPKPANLPLYDDRSRFTGPGAATGRRLSFRGISSGKYGSLYYLCDPGAPLRGGMSVFGPPATLVQGNQYLMAGNVQEFNGETEAVSVAYLVDEGPVGLPAPVSLTVATARDTTTDQTQSVLTGEDYEGMLVQLTGVKVVQRFTPLPTTGFHVAGEYPAVTATIFVDNFSGVLNPFSYPPLDHRVTVVGHLHFSSGTFRVAPRSYADITDLGSADVPLGAAELSLSAYPNPARTAKLAFSLPADADVELGIYDVSGRRVALLHKGALPAGQYTREWNGRDAAGGTAGSGVYFVRLKAGGDVRLARTVFLGR